MCQVDPLCGRHALVLVLSSPQAAVPVRLPVPVRTCTVPYAAEAVPHIVPVPTRTNLACLRTRLK
jgi:hypothetical protein